MKFFEKVECILAAGLVLMIWISLVVCHQTTMAEIEAKVAMVKAGASPLVAKCAVETGDANREVCLVVANSKDPK